MGRPRAPTSAPAASKAAKSKRQSEQLRRVSDGLMAVVQDNRFPIPSPLGSVFVSADAIAEIVSRTAARCYGVVGLAPKTKVARLLGRETASSVAVTSLDGAVKIDLHVTVLYGLNLAEVGA